MHWSNETLAKPRATESYEADESLSSNRQAETQQLSERANLGWNWNAGQRWWDHFQMCWWPRAYLLLSQLCLNTNLTSATETTHSPTLALSPKLSQAKKPSLFSSSHILDAVIHLISSTLYKSTFLFMTPLYQLDYFLVWNTNGYLVTVSYFDIFTLYFLCVFNVSIFFQLGL